MPKRFYVASKKDRRPEADALSERLKAYGWERTFAWGDVGAADHDSYAKTAAAELEGVRAADAVIALLPGGFGTHVEIGAALALGKPVIIHAPNQKVLDTPYPCVFHHHPGVTLLVSATLDPDAVIAALA